MTRVFRGFLLAAGILAVTAGSAYAQGTGSIFGKVTDPSGGVLPGVTVTVTGTGLQRPLVATTGTSGTYQFPSVPIGKYSVTFELSGFKKVTRPNVEIVTNFNAPIDQKLEIGAVSEEMTVTAAAPVVDTKKTTTGATFTKDILENIPTARDPWQIINMTPGVQAGLNVGGSASGQQVGLSVYGTSSNVQWNLEGGSITDLSSNSSPSYFNFDSFEQIQVTTGGGDVSVQSSGLSINLVTKSGSNVFKGTAVYTFENDAMQANNVSQAQFDAGQNGLLSGNPLKKITNASIEYGGPIMRNRLWLWAAADKQDINTGVVNFFDPNAGTFCSQLAAAQKAGTVKSIATYDKLNDVQNCLGQRQDGHQGPRVEVQLPAELGEQDPVSVHERQQVPQPPRRELDDGARGERAADVGRAVGSPAPDALDHAHADPHGQAGLQQPVDVRGRRLLPGLPGRAAPGRAARRAATPAARTRATTRVRPTVSGTSSRWSTRHDGSASAARSVRRTRPSASRGKPRPMAPTS